MNKITKIILIILLILISASAGLSSGLYLNIKNEQAEEQIKEKTLQEVEQRLIQRPEINNLFLTSEDSADFVTGKIELIQSDKITITNKQATLHDIVWGITKQTDITINNDTKIYRYEIVEPENITLQTVISADGQEELVSSDPFKKIELARQDLTIGQTISIELTETNFAKEITIE